MMKDAWKSMKDEAWESSGRMDSKTSKEEGKAVAQTNNHGVKGREEEKERSIEKTWEKNVSKSSINLGEANTQGNTIHDDEIRERKVRAENIIIKGVRDYGENEGTLDLARDFLRDKMLWQGRICQAWRVGKHSDERATPIKVTMSSTHDKQILLSKKQLLRGSHFFLEEYLTIRQQEETREEMLMVRVAKDEGKMAWLYKGKAVIAFFGPPKTKQQGGNQERSANSLAEKYETKTVWENRGEDSTLSLVRQNK